MISRKKKGIGIPQNHYAINLISLAQFLLLYVLTHRSTIYKFNDIIFATENFAEASICMQISCPRIISWNLFSNKLGATNAAKIAEVMSTYYTYVHIYVISIIGETKLKIKISQQ